DLDVIDRLTGGGPRYADRDADERRVGRNPHETGRASVDYQRLDVRRGARNGLSAPECEEGRRAGRGVLEAREDVTAVEKRQTEVDRVGGRVGTCEVAERRAVRIGAEERVGVGNAEIGRRRGAVASVERRALVRVRTVELLVRAHREVGVGE